MNPFIDYSTISLFKGNIEENQNILFDGEEKNSFCILYKDNTIIQSTDFRLIINPLNDTLIDKIYLFSVITDALKFFHKHPLEYFHNSLIIVVDANTKERTINDIKEKYTPKGRRSLKLYLYHRPEKIDLYLLFFKILNPKIEYTYSELSDNFCFNIRYNNNELILPHNKLDSTPYELGLGNNKYKFKNNHLNHQFIFEQIIW